MPYKELIPVANTFIGEEEAKAAYAVVKSGWISMGEEVKSFEKEFAAMVGAKHALAVNNGTAALHVILAALGIGPGDEVIVPTQTFISTANAVIYQGARPVLCETDPRTYNITPEAIEAVFTPRTKAIIPVDMNGMPMDYDAILAFAKKHGLKVIADSAESLGGTYKGRKVGSIAPVHMFSFFPNKNISTGEGGMITTEDDSLAASMRMILNQGQDYRYHHVVLGYNYRMTNIQAAIGREQLKKLAHVIREKQAIAKRYDNAFQSCRNISRPYLPPYVTQHAWYMYPVTLNKSLGRDDIVEKLTKENIQTRLSFPPIHIQPYYQGAFGYKDSDLPVSLSAWRQLIDIPIWVGLGPERQDFVISTLKRLCE